MTHTTPSSANSQQSPALSAIQPEIDAITAPSNLREVSLRNRLLSLILPTVFGTLTLSGVLVYKFFVETKAQTEIKRQLVDEVALASETITQKLGEAIKFSELVATSSDTLDAVTKSQPIVQKSNLDRLSISELEAKFAVTKLLQPNQKLNNYLKQIEIISGLETISYTDRNGFNIAYSNPTSDFVQRDEIWWQKGRSETQWLSSPKLDQSANTVSLELAQGIKDSQTGEFLGVVKAVLPGNYFEPVAANLSHLPIRKSQVIQVISPQQTSAIQTITSQGLSDDLAIIGEAKITEIAALLIEYQNTPQELLKIIKDNHSVKNLNLEIYNSDQNIIATSFTFNDKYYTLMPIANQNLVVVASIDNLELQAAGSELIPILLSIGCLVIISLIMVIISIANKLAQPLIDLATTAEQAAIGNLETVAPLQGSIETQILANSFNNLIFQVKKLLDQQQKETQEAKSIKNITLKINQLQDSPLILNTAIQEIKAVLSVERVIYYQFDAAGQGKTLVESLTADYPATIEATIYTSNWLQKYNQRNPENSVQVINDIQQADFNDTELQKLKTFAVKASLIIPIQLPGKPLALLVAHQCSRIRTWQPSEIDFFEEIAQQLSWVLEKSEFLEQQKNAELQAKQEKEQLQQRALELLREVKPFAQGDLTIRAKVTEDDIGAIANSYNATITSLEKLVNQVKIVAQEVATTVDNSKNRIERLAHESEAQTDSLTQTVAYIQDIDQSIHRVSQRASQAQEIMQQTGKNIDVGDDAINQAVFKINTLQKTVTETEQKVKRLGESSQEIAQVLNSISRFAAQTHLLALKASIEAARAGEQGKGFAVIADEVRSLASQSATATADIENFIAKLQLETSEVGEAMASGIQQVTAGTELVEQTRYSLEQMTTASKEISNLVTEIAQSALQQSETSDRLRANLSQVAIASQENSQSATQVSQEIQQLLTVAAQLQTAINQFKT